MSTSDTLRRRLDGPLSRHPRAGARVALAARQRAGRRPADRGAPRARPGVGARARLRGRHRDGLPEGVRRQGLAGPQRDRRSRRSRWATSRCWSSAACSSGSSAARSCTSAPSATTSATCATSRTMELPGCFAMTETGHGSNVQALRHDRDLRPGREEFVDPHARRRRAQGLHRQRRARRAHGRRLRAADRRRRGARRARAARADPRRGRQRRCAGVRIEDCGAKLGLNGVDNGRIWFDHVRVPRENLLDRYAQVAEDGTYFSPIENPTKRFFTMIGTLIQGRISVCGASISATKVALTIAVRRALERRQFGPPGERGGAADGLPHAPAAAAARAREDLRAVVRAAAARRRAARGVHARRPTTRRGASSRRSPRA